MRKHVSRTVLELSDVSEYAIRILEANSMDDNHYIKIYALGDKMYQIEHNGTYHPCKKCVENDKP
jgi:hypothetical protein